MEVKNQERRAREGTEGKWAENEKKRERRETRKDHRGIHGRWDETGWDEMIVLHVARARTDSINIRGSFGKTRAALWITGATFLYFSGCNAHTPFTLFPSPPPRLSRLPLSFLSRYFPFTIFPYAPVIGLRFSLLPARHVVIVLFFPVHMCRPLFRALSLFYSWPTHDSPSFNGESSLSNCFPIRNCYFLGWNGNCPEMETIPGSYSRNWASA